MNKISILFLITLTLVLSGCGYKASPYYAKPSAEEKSDAL
ncbi:MAG: lipoprotein [Sulfurimonas sp.]